MIQGNFPLHHVGIIRPSETDALNFIIDLGLTEDYRGYVPQWGALCIFTKASESSPLELVVPDAGSRLARFNKGAGGLHHIALTVPSLDAIATELANAGKKFLEPAHVTGAGPFLCNFLSPAYTRGIIVEYIELLER